MRGYLYVGFALLLAGCGSARVAAAPVRTTGVAASCAAVSPAEQFAGARLVFVGVMLPGPTTRLGGRPVLGSPARMRVERYLKGQGPPVVQVDTAVALESDAIGVGEDGIEPRAGERWKIYATSREQPFNTSICGGSTRVTSSRPGTTSGAAALSLWRTFPVAFKPRPIVVLGEGTVLDPTSGFRTEAAKFAYLEGRFRLRAQLPGSVGNFGRFAEVSATVAFHRLRARAGRQYENVPPLIVTGVQPGTAAFATDRGRIRLPAWEFFFRGVDDPASVLALAPPDSFTAPPLHRFGPPGAGSSIEDSATIDRSGRSITISFVGSPAGKAPCDASYWATALSDQRAVAFTITTIAVPVPPGEACPAIAIFRTAVLHLARPLGARVLVSSADGGAIAVTPVRSPSRPFDRRHARSIAVTPAR